MDHPVRNVCIVGGGTAGWSAAAALSAFATAHNISITLIESSAIGTVGVGEASVPNIRNFNRFVGLSELDFITSTNATFKLGIQFKNWRDKGVDFFHPFANYGVELEGVEFHQYVARLRSLGHEIDIEDYSMPIALARAGRFAQPIQHPSSPIERFSYAFHFDATLYAARLRRCADERGVHSIDSVIDEVVLEGESGAISHLVLKDGTKVTADLFIDCSGFRALLIEGALKSKYQSWTHWLPCDRAVALPCAPKFQEISPFTTACAREAGWTWRIPLQNRVGNGYVYASAYISDERALETLDHSLENPSEVAPNFQKFTAGMRPDFWVKNCVSLGLASGFIEPLESTSINLVHSGLFTLMDFWPDKGLDPRKLAAANRRMKLGQENIRDFIILHYLSTSREDSNFWRDIRAMAPPDSLMHKLETYRASGHLEQYEGESFKPESWLAMYEGFGIRPESFHHSANRLDVIRLSEALKKIKASLTSVAAQASFHHTYLDAIRNRY